MWSNIQDLPKATNEKERRHIIETASKQSSDINNPCIKEQNQAYQCLSDNNYDKGACIEAFSNYKTCKDFWFKIVSERKKKGIRPVMPRPDEREQIKAEYKRTVREKIKQHQQSTSS